MDEQTYASVTTVCARLAGRLPDDILGTIREAYAAGEWDLGDATLLLNLAGEGIGITPEERDLIRAFLGDPDTPELLDVPTTDEPTQRYRFSPIAPEEAPNPAQADILLTAEAPHHGGRRLHRTWRIPLNGTRDGEEWVYVLQVAAGTDQLKAYSALASRVGAAMKSRCGLEVVAVGGRLPPYQSAALTASHRIWPA